MRPRKIIVIIDPHEDRQGMNRLALWVNGFHAIGVPSIASAREVAADAASAECGIDLLIGYWPLDEAWFAQLGKEVQIPALFMSSKNATARHLADITLDAGTTSMAELVERVKIISARKRGPRPTPKPVTAVESQEALRVRA